MSRRGFRRIGRCWPDAVLNGHCWLALLLVRIAGNQAGTTWTRMRRELDRIHIGTFTGPAGTFQQVTEPAKTARTSSRP